MHLVTRLPNGRSLRVAENGTCSDLFTINPGVPQGFMLSPTLFLIYINDLLEITDSPIYSFADDSPLVSAFTSDRPISSVETRTHIQHQVLNVLIKIWKEKGINS